MPARDLALLLGAARAAAEIATPFWRKSPETWEKDAGAGPVTEADLAVDAMLRERLIRARPDYGWLSEETEDSTARLSCERVFIIDPIDGTRSFVAGEKTWAHSLAVAENGQVIAGVVFLPILDRLYQARTGGGAYLNGAQIRHSGRDVLRDACVLSTRPSFDPARWPDGLPPVKRAFRASLAYRLALVAQGRFDAMLTVGRTWEWDVAAGTLLATEAGARVSDCNGAAVAFNNADPRLSGLIAGAPVVHAGLSDGLAKGAS